MTAFTAAPGYGNVSNSVLYPEIFSADVLFNLQKVAVVDKIANTNYEGDIRDEGASVKIAKAPVIETFTYTRGKIIPNQTIDFDDKELLIDQAYGFAFSLDDIERQQSHINLSDAALKDAVYRLNDVFDSNVLTYAVAQATNFTSGTVGFGSGELEPTLLFNEARKLLGKANAPYTDCWAVISWDLFEYLAAAGSKIVNANEMGVDKSIIIKETEPMLNLYGMDVYVSNNIAANTALFGHKSALSTAKTLSRYETVRRQDTFGDQFRALMVWGRLATRPEVLFETTWTPGALA